MGLSFEITIANVDESAHGDELPAELVTRLSRAKAFAVAPQYPDALVMAADTIVVLDGDVLGKPADETMARNMLHRLRDRQHLVYSGLTISDGARDQRCDQMAVTPVQMRLYSDDEIDHYIGTGDPMDKAGAYAIQHAEFDPISRFVGCYANVMGLPMCHVYRLLSAWDIRVPVHPLDCCPYAVTQGCPWSEEITHMPPSTWCLEQG